MIDLKAALSPPWRARTVKASAFAVALQTERRRLTCRAAKARPQEKELAADTRRPRKHKSDQLRKYST